MKVGFIGLGLMGLPMARNILKAGHTLAVYNRTASKAEELGKEGALVCSSPKEVAQSSDMIITIVTGPQDVQDVLFGPSGVVEGAQKGSIIIDMSTIGPKSAKEISRKLQGQGLEFMDAPVTGGTMGAINGTLTIFAGGKKAAFDQVLPVFEAMGKNNLYIGPVGSGQAIKLVNNLIVGETLTALAEGFLLGEAQGLTREEVAKFLEQVPAVSPMMKTRFEKMVADDYQVTFSVDNMHKDLKLALEEAQLPILEKVEELYKKAQDEGLGDLDNSAILRVLRK